MTGPPTNTPHQVLTNRTWLVYALLTVALFGVWQVLPKLPPLAAARPMAIQLAALPGLLAALLLTGALRGVWRAPPRGMVWAILTGIAGALGTLAILRAFALGGEGSLVTPLCAMYPLVTALGARFIFRERLGAIQKFGLVLFACAVAAFAFEGPSPLTTDVQAWLPYAALAFLIFGASGLSMKLATSYVQATAALAGWSLGFMGLTLLFSALDSPSLPRTFAFSGLAFAYGLLMGLGLWASFEAYRRGKAATVTAVTALYPAVTVVLAVALPSINEGVSVQKALAVALSLAAGAALAIERSPQAESSLPPVDPSA